MKKISFAIVAVLFLVTCTKEETDPRPYPRVVTKGVDDITSSSVLFRGEITYSSKEIIDHGFIWSTNSTLLVSEAERISLGAKKGKGNFESLVERNLDEGVMYYVKTYVKSVDFTVYGNVVQFVGVESGIPVIVNFFPSFGSLTDTITIVGKNFSSKASSNTVKFNALLSTVVSSTGDVLQVIVPQNLSDINSSISIEIAGKIALSSSQFTLKTPKLLISNKEAVSLCDTVAFDITNLGPTSNPKIYFNGKLSEVVGKTKERIKVLVPVLSSNDTDIQVKLLVGSFESTLPQTLSLNLPDFVKLEPEGTSFLDTITMHLNNMPYCEFEAKIDGRAIPILESSSQYFKVIVPATLDDPWRISLQVYLENEKLFDTLYYRVLKIENAFPTSGIPGDTIKLIGRGFHPVFNQNQVFLNCPESTSGDWAEIIGGNTRELIVRVPQSESLPQNCQAIFYVYTQNMEAWSNDSFLIE